MDNIGFIKEQQKKIKELEKKIKEYHQEIVVLATYSYSKWLNIKKIKKDKLEVKCEHCKITRSFDLKEL